MEFTASFGTIGKKEDFAISNLTSQCLHILTALSFPPLPTLAPSGDQSTA